MITLDGSEQFFWREVGRLANVDDPLLVGADLRRGFRDLSGDIVGYRDYAVTIRIEQIAGVNLEPQNLDRLPIVHDVRIGM